jgi:ABC-type transport system involved in multi-copper enzyme maturation permease subunit
MIWIIAKREFFEKILDFRVIVSFVIAIVLTVVATIIAGTDYHVRKAEYDKLTAEYQLQLKSVKVYSQYKPVVCYPPAPLSVLSRGIDIPTPIKVDIALDNVPRYDLRSAGSNPMMSMFDTLDIATVVRVLFSLLVILLTFDSFSGEKENGTLRQTLSNPVARVNLLYGKFVGTLMIVAVVVCLTFLITVILVRTTSGISFSLDTYIRALFMAGATLLYLAVFAALGITASLWFRHSSTSLVMLLIVWFGVAILIPNLATYVASEWEGTGWLRKAQSSLAGDDCNVYDELARLQNERGNFFENGSKHCYYSAPGRSSSFGSESWKMHPIITDADFDLLDYTMQQVRVYRKLGDCAERTFNKYSEFVLSHLDRQLGMKRVIDLFSPASIFTHAAGIVSRTDIDNIDNFYQQARRYRTDYLTYLDQKGVFSTNAYLYFSRLTREQVDRAATEQRMAQYAKDQALIPYIDDQPTLDLRDAPVFTSQESALRDDAARSLIVLTPLALYFILILILSGIILRSYDPR